MSASQALDLQRTTESIKSIKGERRISKVKIFDNFFNLPEAVFH